MAFEPLGTLTCVSLTAQRLLRVPPRANNLPTLPITLYWCSSSQKLGENTIALQLVQCFPQIALLMHCFLQQWRPAAPFVFDVASPFSAS
jgi:hypothetical protein